MSLPMFYQLYLHDHCSLLRAEPSQPTPGSASKTHRHRSLSLGPAWLILAFVAQRGCTYDIDELRDGEAEAHQDHVRDVGHGTGPLVITREEFLQEPLLCMGSGLHVAKGCGEGMKTPAGPWAGVAGAFSRGKLQQATAWGHTGG